MSTWKKALRFTVLMIPIALVAGWFAAQYSMETMESSLFSKIIEQLGSESSFALIMMAQTVIYAVVCGFFGYLLADRINLIRPFHFEKKIVGKVVGISLLFGCLFSLDAWTFGRWLPELSNGSLYADGFSISNWLASVLYGGIIEEVMMRLFAMSLIAFLIWKIFYGKETSLPIHVLISANIIAAVLFALGHLPATTQSFGHLTPMLVVRCLLLNGAFGMLFGRFYRKFGIQYAMLSHMILHIVSKLIWLVAF